MLAECGHLVLISHPCLPIFTSISQALLLCVSSGNAEPSHFVVSGTLSVIWALNVALSEPRKCWRHLLTLVVLWPVRLEISLVKVCYVLASNCSNTDAACVKEVFCLESTDKYWSSIEPGEQAWVVQWHVMRAERDPTARGLKVLKGLLFTDQAKLDVPLIPLASVVMGV